MWLITRSIWAKFSTDLAFTQLLKLSIEKRLLANTQPSNSTKSVQKRDK